MKRLKVEVQETLWHTYEIEVPDDLPEDQWHEHFYALDTHEPQASESVRWEIEQVETLD